MLPKQEVVAMLLAGGQGSRLGVLTKDIAKPAVPFGGKYRIIDFPLSNCVNSGIETVGVLTQYQPLELNEYIGSGQPWDLDSMNAGVHVLSPYEKRKKTDWYKGTANAITQNIPFIERYNPDYVVVLSGDHIYKMDYSKMISFHKEKGAAVTIAVQPVPMEEASRFGILNTNEDDSIYEFDEKPKKPKSDLANMGIYVFTWEKLRKFLLADDEDPKSSNDFGKNVLPAMLNAGEKMFAYRFEGYWKDVGTIDSLWESNMDLLDPNVPLDLSDADWRIYSRNPVMPPHYVAKGAHVQNSLIAEGCNVYGQLEFSVLFAGVYVAPGAVVTDSIVMPGARIEEGAHVQYAIVAENAVIGPNSVVGKRPEEVENKDEWGVAVVGPDCKLPAGSVVPPKAMIDAEEVEK
ncbi:glucose-1-phosphate adenylyltransferase [Oscillospiraceae bacterium 21-37]|uniref:glucose-1-phosphate adenylyltransferase n=1 Tax=Eubacteriales TaxID=186802 RepID=UPI00136F4C0B|nr:MULTISPECIES: glucose-1-phosphate adenylyltransferase [unclassified Neglectibacter]MCI8395467.1 glucose-1-phosphate adenylyltransferase [Acutalibacter sp.]MCI8920444.1 glucose-1-phosphate adenylyltransferase [Acutalibacter sp.]NBI17567.1 glucose-1-phosphate adenylyltransferase [Neglectibacter sp. 59]NBJ73141.1 glucose-1-phosphate adenylyltransferase [Neglectibacter sp. X4]NCE80996.1 glucose-1-phosphate adenylyltransferase [Neglectibacter sp. X58]